MKQIIFSMLCCSVFINAASAQKAKRSTFGIKAAINIAKTPGNTPNFKPDAKNGFTVAGSYSPVSKKNGLGYRTELVFSRQSFGFATDGKTNAVNNDYIYMPHFTTFGITKFVQLQLGGQVGYLLNSKQETSGKDGKMDITSYTNRFDYGAAGGIEFYPFKGITIGARYNMSFGDTYKQPSPGMLFPLPFDPSQVKDKNAVINFMVGYKF